MLWYTKFRAVRVNDDDDDEKMKMMEDRDDDDRCDRNEPLLLQVVDV